MEIIDHESGNILIGLMAVLNLQQVGIENVFILVKLDMRQEQVMLLQIGILQDGLLEAVFSVLRLLTEISGELLEVEWTIVDSHVRVDIVIINKQEHVQSVKQVSGLQQIIKHDVVCVMHQREFSYILNQIVQMQISIDELSVLF